MKLHFPRRYMEYSMTVIYCVSGGMLLKSAVFSFMNKKAVHIIAFVLIVLGAFRLSGVDIYDYSMNANLYMVMKNTPKKSLIAGHPEIMDNVLTFSKRKVFVAYELAHPWAKNYWKVMKIRTFDFFRAYYSSSPGEVRAFCRDNGIDYLVVREDDFNEKRLKKEQIYFEPFGSFIRSITRDRSKFALMDEDLFKPIYKSEGIRVVKPIQ